MEINYPSPSIVTKLESQLNRPDRDAGTGCSGIGLPGGARPHLILHKVVCRIFIRRFILGLT